MIYQQTPLTKWGGRRFLLCVLVTLLVTGLQAFGKLDAAGLAYVAIIGATVGGFITGNVLQKRADIFAQRDVSVAQAHNGETQP